MQWKKSAQSNTVWIYIPLCLDCGSAAESAVLNAQMSRSDTVQALPPLDRACTVQKLHLSEPLNLHA